VGDDGHHDVELELASLGRERHRRIKAQGLEANLIDHFRDRRIHLAGHDAGPRLHSREDDSARPVRGPEASRRMSLAILLRSRTKARKAPLSVAMSPIDCISLDPVGPFTKLQARDLSEMLDHQPGIFDLRVDACADGGPADTHIAEPVGGLEQLPPMALDGVTVRGELLPQTDRRGILQMGSTRLHDSVEVLPLGEQSLSEAVECRECSRKRGESGQDAWP